MGGWLPIRTLEFNQ